MAAQILDPKKIFIDVILVAIVAAAVFVAANVFGLNLAIGIILLGGSWFVDNFLKHMYELETTTIFADLALASFVYSGSYTLNLIPEGKMVLVNSAIVYSGVIAFILFIFWIANLSMCKLLFVNHHRNMKGYKVAAWVFSILFSGLGVVLALAPIVKT